MPMNLSSVDCREEEEEEEENPVAFLLETSLIPVASTFELEIELEWQLLGAAVRAQATSISFTAASQSNSYPQKQFLLSKN